MQFTLTLKGSITHDGTVHDLSESGLRANLDDVIHMAMSHGLITGNASSELESWSHSIDIVTEPDRRLSVLANVYQSEHGWGYVGCESDDYENEIDARCAALAAEFGSETECVRVDYLDRVDGTLAASPIRTAYVPLTANDPHIAALGRTHAVLAAFDKLTSPDGAEVIAVYRERYNSRGELLE